MPGENQSIGTGVYVLSVIWIVSAVLCVVSVRTGRALGAVSLVVSSLITLLLLSVPRGSADSDKGERVYDKLFVLRYCTLTFMLLSSIGGLGYYVVYHCMTPVETVKLRHWTKSK